jgi:transposase
MVAQRRVVEFEMSEADRGALEGIARSRSEKAGRVLRARLLLAYRETPSFYAVGRRIGVAHQTVTRCVERARDDGVMAALDEHARPGKAPTITSEARAWLVSLACDKAKEHGYPQEIWTTRLLTSHAQEHCVAAGHDCLSRLSQGTLCKILAAQDIKPHKVRYYLERRDPDFAEKMAEVLCVYREVALLREADDKDEMIAILSYDEKPGIQALGTVAPDLPPGIPIYLLSKRIRC